MFMTAAIDSPVFRSAQFLRRVLQADGLSCLATGALQVAFATPLATLLGLPRMLLLGTGAFLLAYAAIVFVLASRPRIPHGFVWVIVAGNLLWAVDCAFIAFGSFFAPTVLGQAWVLAQAVVVVVLAELQWLGLRRGRAATAG